MKLFASLKLTIACLIASILLVFWGTLEQAQMGLYAAQEQIFHTFFVTWKGWPIFPGGYTLGILLLINLICAHITRFKWSWKHLGITILHFGLIFFIAGELLTTLFSNESQVAIKVGDVTNYAESTRKLELVVGDLSHPDYDEIHTVSASALRKGASFAIPNTPFIVHLRELYPHASLSTLEAPDPSSLANRGLGVTLAAQPLPPQQKDQLLDTMVLFVELKDGAKTLGTWLLSNVLPWPQLFRYQGKEYSLSLRRARTYFPFTLELTQFIHETYPGSTIPKNFSSRLNLYDAEGNFDRSAEIYMNHPLYLQGYTFYQASFGQQDTLSILQMVENASWPLPYLSSFLVAGGLCVQFISSLMTYRKTRNSRDTGKQKEIKRKPFFLSAPLRLCASALKFTLLFLGLSSLYLFTTTSHRAEHEEARFVPVQHEGRIKPLDTVARVNLLLLHGTQSLKDSKNTLLPIDWLVEALTNPTKSSERPLFRIDHPELQAFLNKTPEESHYFSYKRLSPHLKVLQEQATLLNQKEEGQLDAFQKALLKLTSQIHRYLSLEKTFQFVPISNVSSFKIELETLYNSFHPFFLAIFFYLLAFFAAIFSWVLLPHSLSRLSFSLLMMGFLVHTLGIAIRMYLEGRPPVTNLYSSALFVGWMAAFLGIILEKAFRNTFGTLVAALIGSLTLIIAHHLADGSDTLQVMQAVLNSNLWLSTHVVAITTGYSATFIAGFLGCFYVFYKLLCKIPSPATEASLSKMVYGIICFATLFSFVGTVLGGIWADQSWGRFWGWDPKENGALMIVLWNAIILHVRWGGLLSTHGIMLLAIFGNIIVSFSWFGVNMLGVGLHSYGFMESAFFWLLLFMLSQLMIIALGLICFANPRKFP